MDRDAPMGRLSPPPLPRVAWGLAALVAGFIIAREATPLPPGAWLALGAGCCAIAGVVRGIGARVALLLATVCLGAGWLGVRAAPVGGPWPALAARSEPTLIDVRGTLLDVPRADEPAPSPLLPRAQAGWSATLRVDSIVGEAGVTPAGGVLRVRGEGPPPSAGAGERVRLPGVYRGVAGPSNPGERDRRALAAQEGRVGTLRAGRATTLERLEHESTIARARGWWIAVRAAWGERAQRLLLGSGPGGEGSSVEARALLRALVLGDDPGSRDLEALRDAFAHTGLAHVLSISGFHLVVLVFAAMLAIRLWGDLGTWESALIAGLIAAYLAILPFDAPVWRSAMMVLALLLGEACGRRYDRLAILCWVAIALLLHRPLDAWSMGFQLSFGLVAVLIRFGERFHHRLWGEPLAGVVSGAELARPAWANMGLESARALISTNVLCAMVSMPVVAFHTGMVSPLAPLIGVVAVPLVSALLVLSYAGVLVGALLGGVPAIGDAIARGLERLAEIVAAFVRWCDAMPGAWTTAPRLSLAWCITCTLGLLWLAWTWGWWRRKRAAPWAVLAALALWTGAEVVLGGRLARDVTLRVDTLAVGDGTCHLVRSGGEALLWDAGSLENGPGLGRYALPRALREVGAWRVRTAVITHPNLDHYNALPGLVGPLGIREVLVCPLFLSRAAAHAHGGEAFLLADLSRRGVRVRAIEAGERLSLGECEVTFLSPPRGMTEAEWPADNDHCLVARFDDAGELASHSFDFSRVRAMLLLCGDVQAPAIDRVRQEGAPLHADVMEVPHHGSAKDAAMRWALEVSPRVLLQSTGAQRADDPRWDGVRDALAGSTWWCTWLDGAAWAEVTGTHGVRTGACRAREIASRPTNNDPRP